MVREVIEVVLLVAVISLSIRLTIATQRVVGPSMEPNFHQDQLVMVNKLAYIFGSPQRGDVIVFYYPNDTSQIFIKRIIGLPGDTIQVTPGTFSVNDHLLSEKYISSPVSSQVRTCKLGKDNFYVMGDNRPVSDDSRTWGVLDRKYIIGKVTFTYWPFKDLHGINTYSDTFSGIATRTPPAKSSGNTAGTPDSCIP